MRLRILLAGLVLCGGVGAARAAQSGFFSSSDVPAGPATMADLATAENAVADIWSRLPYGTRNVMFVTQPAEIFGGYAKRPTTVFAPGEKLLTYLEPLGYRYKSLDDGRYQFGITTDFELMTPGGKVLGGQKNIQTTNLTSHTKNREFFVGLTMTLDGIQPGDYVLVYTLHDTVGGQTTKVEQPFSIKSAS